MNPEDLHLRVFLVVVPQPLPIATGSTTSFVVPGNSANLPRFQTRITEDSDASVGVDGDFLVSLKFWQFDATLNRESQTLKALLEVANEIHRLPQQNGASYPDTETNITVVEMVTNSLERLEGDDPFGRCMECLSDFFRALRIMENLALPKISRQSLWPLAFTFLKDGSGKPLEEWRVMTLGHANSITSEAPEAMSRERSDRAHIGLSRLRLGDPWMIYGERRRDLNYSFYVDGDYSMTVVHAAIACEVLLMTALTLGMWESGLSASEAAEKLSVREINPLVSGPLAALYGGNWDRNSNQAVKAWRDDVAKKRNRIVHEGYRASEEEGERAFTAAGKLHEFVTSRLQAQVAKFPRTCLMAFGEPGLKRRGIWTRRIREFSENQALTEDDWLQSYATWRTDVDQHLT